MTTGPLQGVNVLDLTAHFAGQFGSMILADLGANVVKIEDPQVKANMGRGFSGDPRFTYKEDDSFFLAFNRNKKSIALDLKAPLGKQVFNDLVEKFGDVVFDNFRPGVLERLGADYETLRRTNPRIISCSITSSGTDGPYSGQVMLDVLAQAVSGALSFSRYGVGRPVQAGFGVADGTAAMFAAHGVLAALYAREKTGVGQRVDTSLVDGQIALSSQNAMRYFVSGEPAEESAPSSDVNPLFRCYRTEDDFIAIAPHHRFWKNLARALGREDLARRFDTPAKVMDRSLRLAETLQDIFAARTTAEWVDILLKDGVPCAPVNTLAQALSHPQVLHRKMVVEVDDPWGGHIKMIGNPIKMSGAGGQQYEYPPRLGQHTDEVLCGNLGYSKERMAELRRTGTIR